MRIAPIALEDGEKIRAEFFANLFRGWEGVGGILYVTDRRVRFESHGLNYQVGPAEMRLKDISSVCPIRTIRIICNGLRIETADGRSFQFVVWRPSRVATVIEESLPGTVKQRGIPSTLNDL